VDSLTPGGLGYSAEFRLPEERVLNSKKIIIVMPAYNAAKTLRQTYDEVPLDIVDEVLLVDDGSSDETVQLARELGLTTFQHERNFGYGRNQKTCYREALRRNGDIVIMVHPDYQYSPKLIVPMAGMIAYGEYDVALGSRILGNGAVRGGMPVYKYVANRFLTAFENLLLRQKLSEYHTGYRAFSRQVLETLPLGENTDDFVFDNEMLAQAAYFNFRIGEVSCPTKYFAEASSINFRRSVTYGIGVLLTSLKYRLQRMGLANFRLFSQRGTRLRSDYYKELNA
jgi:glycosyltransferase involved in cell wall biosynthesis